MSSQMPVQRACLHPLSPPVLLSPRCIRQTMYNISLAEDWKGKHNILFGDYKDIQGSYSDLISRSVFCFVIPGACSGHVVGMAAMR